MLLRWKSWPLALVVLASVRISAAGEPVMRASKPEVKAEIVAVITAQFAAFQAGDVRKAYGYSAAELRAQKPLPAFKAIVQSSYPEIWSNTRAEFGIVRDDGRRATVTVQVFSRESGASYDYTLVKEQAGWRIFGVLRHEPKKAGKF